MNEEYRYSNREMASKPKLGKAWCDGCDRWFGPVNYGKCPECGYKSSKRLKKDTSAR